MISKISLIVLAFSGVAKRIVVMTVDVIMCALTVWLAFYLRLGELISFSGQSDWARGVVWSVIASIGIALPIFIGFGLYRVIFRYSDLPVLLAVARAVGVYGLIFSVIFTGIGVVGVPRTVGIIQPILLFIFVATSRALAKFLLGNFYLNKVKHSSRTRVMIYGAGSAGRQLAMALANSNEMKVIGFLDDDDALCGRVISGLRIYKPLELVSLVPTLMISNVLLAMPSVSRSRRNEILSHIRNVQVSVRTLPSVTDLAQGKVSVSDLRELDIDDLLGRESVIPNSDLLDMRVRSKVVMVTGAGGSIGSELCRQILSVSPAKLLLIDQSEYALYAIHQELEKKLTGQKNLLVPLLASVQDETRMREIMSTWLPETIYHAAAYKHVPLVEHNPAAGINNNVMGTFIAAKVAAEIGVTDFVLISTDKAVRPTNVMGASKRLAEMVIQALAANVGGTQTGTCFCIVRFGNVLGSSGSVVPKFRQQIRDGGPITLTHPEVTRYFMTIPEAAQLVIQAGAMAKGGDVFVLDMGKPVKIFDLARRMVDLSGLSIKDRDYPQGDIEIAITGLRPGEKLYEELLIGNNPKPTVHPRIMQAVESYIPWTEFEAKLKDLQTSLKANDVGLIRQLLRQIVDGYNPNEDIVDWVYLEQRAHLQTSQ